MSIKLRDLPVKTTDFNKYETSCIATKDQTAMYACQVSTTFTQNNSGLTCHNRIRSTDPKNISSFSGVYNFKSPGAPELFEFLISETGPFQDLRIYDGVYLFGTKENEPCGFTLPDHVFQREGVYPLLYAFLINSRIPHENAYHAEAFAYLCAAGHNPNLMFIMSKYLAITSGMLTTSGRTWDFGHNSFVEQQEKNYGGDPCYIDVRMFCNNEYHKDVKPSAYTRELWKLRPSPERKPLLGSFMWEGYSKKLSTRFTSIERIASENEIRMIEDFKKFVDMRYV